MSGFWFRVVKFWGRAGKELLAASCFALQRGAGSGAAARVRARLISHNPGEVEPGYLFLLTPGLHFSRFRVRECRVSGPLPHDPGEVESGNLSHLTPGLQVSGSQVSGFGFRVSGCRASGFGFRGFGFRAVGSRVSGCRVLGKMLQFEAGPRAAARIRARLIPLGLGKVEKGNPYTMPHESKKSV